MGSYCYGGEIQLIPNRVVDSNNLDDYPFDVPKVILEGYCDDFLQNYLHNRYFEAICEIRGNIVTKYTKQRFLEILAEDEDGNMVWMDVMIAPDSNQWKETRSGVKICVEEYDMETLEKRKYKVTLDETTPLNDWEIKWISNYIDINQTEVK